MPAQWLWPPSLPCELVAAVVVVAAVAVWLSLSWLSLLLSSRRCRHRRRGRPSPGRARAHRHRAWESPRGAEARTSAELPAKALAPGVPALSARPSASRAGRSGSRSGGGSRRWNRRRRCPRLVGGNPPPWDREHGRRRDPGFGAATRGGAATGALTTGRGVGAGGGGSGSRSEAARVPPARTCTRTTGVGSAAITIDGDDVRGRLSGLSASDAGPRRRAGVSRRPIAAVSDSAATAPCAQESLM